jgi:hypothetical protein
MKTTRAIFLRCAVLLIACFLTGCATAPQSTPSPSVITQPKDSPASDWLVALECPILWGFSFLGSR